MASELWQRIRAARKYADLRQQDVADVCGVSRAAVAQWEYDDDRRTTPSIEQVRALAKRSKVPFEWLLDDSANLGDIWQQAKVHSTPEPVVIVSKLLEQAIQYEVLQARPDLAPGFALTLGQAPFAIRPDFMWDRVAVEFATELTEEHAARLLLTEQAAGRKMNKTIILVDRDNNTQAMLRVAMTKTFGIDVVAVSSAQDAAKKVIELCT